MDLINSKRTLGTFSIWAIGVGLVISGESFGWNPGWGLMGPVGFLVPVIVVTIMYYALIRCNIELACVYPDADSPSVHVTNAFGKNLGRFIALATLVEFIFAAPAIAYAIGDYIKALSSDLSQSSTIAIFFMCLFCLINNFRLGVSTIFVIVLTLLAVTELLIYSSQAVFHSEIINFISSNNDNYSLNAFFQSLPYAVWLYLGIEGISLLTRNVKTIDYKRKISIGYKSAFFTLVTIVFVVLYLAGSGVKWSEDTWAGMTSGDNAHPLPYTLKLMLSTKNASVQIFTLIGLFGLIASLQGIILAAIAQVNSLIEPIVKQYTIGKLNINSLVSSILVLSVGIYSILTNKAYQLVELSAFGAVCMYLFNCLSLLKFRLSTSPNFNKNYYGHSEDGSILHKHEEFNKWVSISSSIIVISISSMCLFTLMSTQYHYFKLFLLIAIFYLLLFNYKNLFLWLKGIFITPNA